MLVDRDKRRGSGGKSGGRETVGMLSAAVGGLGTTGVIGAKGEL